MKEGRDTEGANANYIKRALGSPDVSFGSSRSHLSAGLESIASLGLETCHEDRMRGIRIMPKEYREEIVHAHQERRTIWVSGKVGRR